MQSYYKVAFETTVTFFVLLVMTRLLGKKQLSHCTFFNYVAGITVGSIAGAMIILDTKKFLLELTGLVIFCILTVLVGLVNLKSPKLRILFDGQPTILIKKGMIDKKALFFTGLNIDDLTMLLRGKDVFSVTEADYAILEPDGSLSVLKKSNYQEAQKVDVQAQTLAVKHLPAEIIADGKVIEKNLTELGLNHKWLDGQLKQAGVESVREVFYAEVLADGGVFLQRGK